VLRGMKTDETPTREGLDIYYNFIGRCMTLNGQTPAEKANIDVTLDQSRWLSLLEQRLNHHRRQTNIQK